MAGLRDYTLALLISGSLAAPLQADLKIHVQETFGRGGTTSLVYYCKEHFWRTESPGDREYMIVDWVNKRSISVDPAKRQYVLHSPPPNPEATDSTEMIVVEIETRDTREQRERFGHAARRFMTTERRHIEYRDRPPSAITEIVTDGWYLDIPGPFPILSRVGSVHLLAVRSSQQNQPAIPKVKVTRSGPAPKGLAVWEQTGDNLLEVTEFSETPLDPRLFEVPAGFHRVVRPLPGESLSWLDQLILYWQEIEDWFGHL
jgi:hypothetical protein